MAILFLWLDALKIVADRVFCGDRQIHILIEKLDGKMPVPL